MINNTISAVINKMQAVVEDGAGFQCIENLWMILSKSKNISKISKPYGCCVGPTRHT